jgi:hypothetical protein
VVSSNDVTWQVLTVCLTLVGLVGTGIVWRLRGPVAGLRALALSLLPAAAYLTGTLRLFWEVGDAVVSWAVRFAFSPVVWLGIVLAGVSVTLLVLAGVLSRVSSGRRERRELDARASRAPATGSTQGGSPSAEDAEITAILKRHGIT